jgi:hypothetical protein
MQNYINKRSQEGVAPVTVQREVEQLVTMRIRILCPPITRGLVYPKKKAKVKKKKAK